MINMKDFFDLIARRESCRNYDPNKKVETEKLVKCIEAARLAPSACNSQPWSFVAVENEALLPEVAKCAQTSGINQFTDDAGAFFVIQADFQSRFPDNFVVFCATGFQGFGQGAAETV